MPSELEKARQNLTTKVMRTYGSLQAAIIQAGGSPQVLDPDMTIGELIQIIALNDIEFVYKGQNGR